MVSARAFLSGFARDTRANTLAIMAIALIPLAGMVGGGIDISRMYIVKTRLQHACDAGALAGRKTMGGGTWSQTVNGTANFPEATAKNYFDANYNKDAYGASSVTKAFTENAGKVSGTASAVLPMTLMRIFGKTTETLSVTCDAEMRLPNTDVMFVLDVTGSMASKAVNTDPDTKIDSLKTAVKCFYEIVARLDTDANCTTGNPSGGVGNQVQIRFGFVPYSVNVNVGRLLPNSYFPDSWTYQTRQANWNPPGTTSNGPYWEEFWNGSINQDECLKFMKNEAFPGFIATTTSSGTAPGPTTVVTFPHDGVASAGGSGEWGWNGSWDSSGSDRACRRLRTDTTTTYVPQFKDWTYDKYSINISGLKAGGSNWNTSFNIPQIGSNGTDRTVSWNGCIEERQTVSGTSFSPIPSDAKDLDVDSAPGSGSETMWKPALGAIEYARRNGGTYTTGSVTYSGDFSQPDAYCPAESRKLQTWATATAFDDYVDSLQPVGNTYHDIGMLWGARLISPTGIFKAENQYTPQGGEIERHLIFMTDGDTQTSTSNYAAYGYPWYDRRNVAASDVGNSPGSSDMNDEVNARFAALCTVVKNKNITLWVISFGSGSNTTTEDRLKACATDGRYFTARNSAELQATFKSIADQISQLRLTK